MMDELEEWQREREQRRKVSEPVKEESIPESKKPASTRDKRTKAARNNRVWRYVLKGVIVFALLRRVFMNAIASAESPSAYGAPTAANYAESAIIIIFIVLFFTKRKLASILLGAYASLLLIGSLIGFGIDANGKVWMMLTAVIVLAALLLMRHFERDPNPQAISDDDMQRLKENPVRRY